MGTVSNVSFGSQEQTQRSSGPGVLGYAGGAGLGAVAGGFGFQRPRNVGELKSDSFEKTSNLSKEQEQAVKKIKRELDQTEKSIENSAKKEAEALLGKGKKSIKVEAFLTKSLRPGDTLAKKGKVEARFEKYIEKLGKELEKESKTLEGLNEKVSKAEGKKNIQAAEKAVTDHKGKISELTEFIETAKGRLELAKSAEDGKITKDMLVTMHSTEIKNGKASKIEKLLETLGKERPKKFSGKAAAIGAVIGAAVIFIGSKIFGSSEG